MVSARLTRGWRVSYSRDFDERRHRSSRVAFAPLPIGSPSPGVRVIAKQFRVDPGTVQRISRPFAAASVAAAVP
jgi:hypothetical protein